jgi:acetate kinase
MPRVLTVNTGSSSVKAAVFDLSHDLARCGFAAVERINTPETTLHVRIDDGRSGPDEPLGRKDHAEAVGIVLDRLRAEITPLAIIAHRFVHGGEQYVAPQAITRDLLTNLEALTPLAPDHLPPALQAVDCTAGAYPDVPQVACFDTAFHRTLPEVARAYPLPRTGPAAAVRRYGFHGLSCEYVMRELAARDSAAGRGRVIIAHLGSGSSLTAVRDGASVDTTMGFSPTGGIMMSSRPGDLDPGVLLFLLANGLTPQTLGQLLSHDSGLRGVSGVTGDMRDLLGREPSDAAAAQAIALYCYLARKAFGGLVTVLGGLDTLVFTGGIGEHAAPIRARLCGDLDWLGLRLDAALNAAHAPVVSTADSRVTVRVIQTDEDLMLATHAQALLRESKTDA